MIRPEIKAHTGLRGLAALNVALGHSGVDAWFPFLHGVHNYVMIGNQAVDLFFVLSGFILSYSYHPRSEREEARFSWRNFFLARLARLYPLHLVTLLLVGGMAWVAARHGAISGEYNIRDLVVQLLLLSSLPVVGVPHPWNYPSWSISTEWLCYLFCFPLTYFARRKLTNGWAILGVIGLTSFAVFWLLRVPEDEPLSMGANALIRGSCGFITGWLLYHLSVHAPRIRKLATRALVVVALAVLVGSIIGRIELAYAWYLLLLWPPLVLGTTDENSPVSKLLAIPPFLILGELSYSIYMLHAVFRKMANVILQRHPVSSPLEATMGGIVFFTLVGVTSFLSYRYFERPAREWIRRRFGATRTIPVGGGDPAQA